MACGTGCVDLGCTKLDRDGPEAVSALTFHLIATDEVGELTIDLFCLFRYRLTDNRVFCRRIRDIKSVSACALHGDDGGRLAVFDDNGRLCDHDHTTGICGDICGHLCGGVRTVRQYRLCLRRQCGAFNGNGLGNLVERHRTLYVSTRLRIRSVFCDMERECQRRLILERLLVRRILHIDDELAVFESCSLSADCVVHNRRVGDRVISPIQHCDRRRNTVVVIYRATLDGGRNSCLSFEIFQFCGQRELGRLIVVAQPHLCPVILQFNLTGVEAFLFDGLCRTVLEPSRRH